MFSCGGLREIPEHGNMQCAQCMADMLSRYLAKFVTALWKRIIYEAAHLVMHLFETKEFYFSSLRVSVQKVELFGAKT